MNWMVFYYLNSGQISRIEYLYGLNEDTAHKVALELRPPNTKEPAVWKISDECAPPKE